MEVGDIVDDMEVIEITRDSYDRKSYRVKCQKCGREKIMLKNTMDRHSGTTHKACGKGLKTQNKFFYDRWQAMRTRTTNPNYVHWADYGGRGIKSDEFELFIDFYDAMYESFEELGSQIGYENTSLERIDVNKDYTKDNCTWIHINEQKGNQRKTVYFIAENINTHEKITSKNLTGFCREYDLNPSCIRDVMTGRLKSYKGWKIKRI